MEECILSQNQLEMNAKCGKQDDSSLFKLPLTTSPATSLTNSDSFASTSSDSSIDLNGDKRIEQVGSGAESGLDDLGDRPNGWKTSSHVIPLASAENFYIQSSNGHKEERYEDLEIKDNDDDSTFEIPEEESKVPPLFEDATDAEVWIPPQAVNEDFVYSLDDDDNDDECGDGEWGIPSSLSGFGDDEGSSRSCLFKEEEEKAMKEVRNGKFRILVTQLLKTAGIVDLEKGGESWVDIVSALAWSAALFVKPPAAEANVMDPATYVKVKCVATGSRSQSQLIKGLVFKKHAAHKRMPTRYMKPKILLIQGMLESSGLSSFNSMIVQDKDNVKESMGQDVKSFIENLEASHPDVVFVEKSAPRDVLEAILKMGVTLVADMKLHRLERIARFTGSPILSADVIHNQKLKQCDMLYFDKFVEDHAQVVEGGKKPSKTLMFLVGSSTNQGCTILLKGSHSEELKKIKCVIQYAVVIAYHFILETSFLINQKAMFSTIVSNGVNTTGSIDFSIINPRVSQPAEFPIESGSGDGINLPVSSGDNEEHLVESSVLSTALNSMTSGSDSDCFSCSLKRNPPAMPALANQPINVPIFSSSSQESLQVDQPTSTCIQSYGVDIPISNGFCEGKTQESAANSSITPISREPVHYGFEPTGHSDDEKLLDADNNSQSLFSLKETNSDVRKTVIDSDFHNVRRGAISTVLDSESILVLMSSRNASRGTICEQIHFSHIKFYKNFDVPLGRFLEKNLFNQNVSCKACGQLPEAHFYYYAHHNKQLTIRVKQIPVEKALPGSSEGKLWMWSRCGKCKTENEANKSETKRVLLSSAARCLSFGKFLELGFRNHSFLNRLSKCGHSLHRDFLYFFGLGNMVAMFKYSSAVTYFVSVPPQKLEFNNSIKKEWLQKETEKVYNRAMSMFAEIANYLKKVEHILSSSSLNLNGSVKEYSDIEKMLEAEKLEFEENIEYICKNGESVRKHLRLNRVRWELLLEACIWNRRLQLLLSFGSVAPKASLISIAVQEKSNADHYAAEDSNAGSPAANTGSPHTILDDNNNMVSVNQPDVEVRIEHVPDHSEFSTEFQFKPQQAETSSFIIDGIPVSSMESPSDTKDSSDIIIDHSKDGVSQTENTPASDQMIIEIPTVEDLRDNKLTTSKSFQEKASSALSPTFDDFKGEWIWNPFSEIREKCIADMGNMGVLLRFQGSLRYPLQYPELLSTLPQIINEEGSRMHIPLCSAEYVLSDYEGEVSSIIACALAMMEDMPQETENLSKSDDAQSSVSSVSTDESVILSRATSELVTSSSTSIQSDVIHHPSSLSLVESRFSSFDGLNLLDSLVSYGARHPEVALGMDKLTGKGKYSVVCVHAKEFQSLRKRCCPSEIDYIASLSRCKTWDAKGGKSKSLFAKTLDDRLIIKEIKRTEFDSFIKFARSYFQHMEQSFESGNQTCLAKILGIYQVTMRQPKSGKEIKHDLMVMENLTFGRNITRQYDLKGALHARFTENSDGSEDVLLDQNFVNDMNASPFYVVQKAKRILQRAVWNDTSFLNLINVMDYSLLVGIDRDRKELVCGIIDYLRQYTWDKQLETWVKSSLVVPKNVLPTVISPREYKKRFRKFMDTHFLTVPDCWRSQKSSVPCKLCGVGGHHSLQTRNEMKEE